MDHFNLKESYKDLKDTYPNLVSISEEKVNSIYEEYQLARREYNTVIYIIATVLTLLTLFILPFSLSYGYEFAQHILPEIKSFLIKPNLFENLTLAITALITSAGIVIYGFFVYRWKLSDSPKLKIIKKSKLDDINSKATKFILFQIILLYLLGYFLILLTQSFVSINNYVIDWVLFIWIYIPIVSIILIGFFVIVMIPVVLFFKTKFEDYSPESKIRGSLLELLKTLNEAKKKEVLSFQSRKSIARKISRIADQISNFYSAIKYQDESINWVKSKFQNIGNNFRTLQSLILIPNHETLDNIESEVLLFTNSFLSGNYEKLPTSLVKEEKQLLEGKDKLSNLNSFFSFGILLIYLLLPIFTIILLHHFQITIPEIIQPTISIIYIAWIIIGLITYFNRLAPDAKEAAIELLKLILNK